MEYWLVVSTQLKNISQNGNLLQIKNIWNHHLEKLSTCIPPTDPIVSLLLREKNNAKRLIYRINAMHIVDASEILKQPPGIFFLNLDDGKKGTNRTNWFSRRIPTNHQQKGPDHRTHFFFACIQAETHLFPPRDFGGLTFHVLTTWCGKGAIWITGRWITTRCGGCQKNAEKKVKLVTLKWGSMPTKKRIQSAHHDAMDDMRLDDKHGQTTSDFH